MKGTHRFKTVLHWENSPISQEGERKQSPKNHLISVEGKVDLSVSAAKVFKGDANLHNPEDLLLSSLSSCHMMSYLYCCQQNNIEVLSYSDQAEAILETFDDGSGRITKVILNPQVCIGSNSDTKKAHSLHQQAHALCFIANSCNFPVEFNVRITQQ